MCVIILTNPNNQISKEELQNAWSVNSHGAGIAYAEGGAVHFQRGFMNRDYFIKTVLELQKSHDLLLHLRISTGAGVTPQGTHPYKAGNVLKMAGTTRQPVIAMNGIINGQKLEVKQGVKLNDTASYIKDHAGAFKVVNADILDIVASDTGARWAAVTPDGIIHSNNFEEYDGRQYSNLNHVWTYNFINDVYDYEYNSQKNTLQYLEYLLPEKLLERIKQDKRLYLELREYEYQHCRYYDCHYCNDCLANCNTKQDLINFLNDNDDIWDKINGGW